MEELNARDLQKLANAAAAAFLASTGDRCEVNVEGYECREGSVELTAREGDCTLLVRVRARRGESVIANGEDFLTITERDRRRAQRVMACYLMDNYPCSAIRYDVMNVICSESRSILSHWHSVKEWSAQHDEREMPNAVERAVGNVADSIMEGMARGAGIDERDAIESLCHAVGVKPDGRSDWVADFARCLKTIARGIEAEREGEIACTGAELLAELESEWRGFTDEAMPFEAWLGDDPKSIDPAALYRADSMLNYERI